MTAIALKNRQLPAETVSHRTSQFLIFAAGGEWYALSILNIKEIIDSGPMSSMPMMPAYMPGVINLRGSVVPVIDLRARLGKTATRKAQYKGIVIVENKDTPQNTGPEYFGILVETVHEVLSITQQDIQPPPNMGNNWRSNFIVGLVKRKDRFIVLLNLSRVIG